jgi:tetratricopeptide (TPR) repeat protein
MVSIDIQKQHRTAQVSSRMQLVFRIRRLVPLVLLASCASVPIHPQAGPEPDARPETADHGSIHRVLQTNESDAFFHYMRGVMAELDAMLSNSEGASIPSLERSVSEFESVIQLGFSPAALRISLARTLRFLAARTSDPQLQRELFVRAKEHYRAAVLENRDSTDALDGFLSLEQEVFQTPPEALVQELRALLGQDRDNLALWKRLCELYVQMGRAEDARQALVGLSESRPQDGRVWFERGRVEYAAQRYEDALHSFDQAIQFRRTDEELFEAMRQKVLCNYGLGRLDVARGLLDELVAKQPTSAENWVHLAEYHLAGKDYVKAQAALDRALTLEPNNFYGTVLLGQVFGGAGRASESLATYERLAQLWPRRPEAWRILGDAQLEHRLYEKAAASLEQALRIDPQHMATRFSLAEAYRLGGRLREAETILDALVTEVPDNPAVLRALFFLKLDLEDFLGAYQIAARTLGTEPKGYLSHYMMGCVLERLGRLDEAAVHLREAIILKPDFATARNYLGYLYADQGVHLEDSVREIRVALVLDPGNGSYLDSLGWAFFKMKRLDEALRYLTQATDALDRAGSPEPLVWEHLGDVLFEMSCFGRAQRTWKQALNLDKKGDRRAALQDKLRRVDTMRPGSDACPGGAVAPASSASR